MEFLRMTPEQMDAAAEEALEELSRLPEEIVEPVAKWFAKHYMRAGHKRLGRVLVQSTK